MPLPSPKARVPPKVTNIFDICFIYIYITSFIVVITPPHLKHLLPPICICFWHRRYGGVFFAFLYFVGAIIGRPLPIFLLPPLSRHCRQLPSTGALQIASPWGEVARSDGVVAIHQPHSVGAIIFCHTQPPLSRPCRQLLSMGAFFLPLRSGGNTQNQIYTKLI